MSSLVLVPAYPGLGRDDLAARRDFHETHQRKHERRGQQVDRETPFAFRHAHGRQPRRNIAHDHAAHAFEADRPRDIGRQRRSHEHAGKARRYAPEDELEHDGAGAEGERRQVGRTGMLHDLPDRGQHRQRRRKHDTQQRRQLRQPDQQCRGIVESDQHRVRQKIEQHAQAQRAEHELDRAGQQCEHDRAGEELFSAGVGERRNAGRRQQRTQGHGSGRELRQRAEQRAHDGRQQHGIQAPVGGDAGQLRIGERLRRRHQRDRQAGNDIVMERTARRARPREERQESREHRCILPPPPCRIGGVKAG